MNLATHILIGMAVFGRRGAAMRTGAAAFGGVLPDLPAIALELWATLVGGHSPTEIYRDLYFSDAWQGVLAPSHSFFVWGAVLAIALLAHRPLIQVSAAAALLHLVCDFPVHGDDAHRHFWPLSDWRFQSPISYWHPERYGYIVAPVEFAVLLGLVVFLFRRHRSRRMLVLLAALVLGYAAQMAIYATLA